MPDSEPITLDDQLCFALYGASMAVGRLYKPLLDRLGITYPQYLVLSALWERDNQSVGAVAGRLALEASTVTPLLKRLEAAGLVRRVRNQDDERQVLVSLTQAGARLRSDSSCLGEALLCASGFGIERLQRLNDEVRALRDLVSRETAQSSSRDANVPEIVGAE